MKQEGKEIGKLNDALIEHLSSLLNPNRKETLDKAISLRTKHICLVLENIRHTQNSSAIIRTAEIMGVQDVHVVRQNYQNDLRRDITKGAEKWMEVRLYDGEERNIELCFNYLKKKKYKIAVTCLDDDSKSIEEIPLIEPLAIVMGEEVSGVSDFAKANADYKIKLPMYGLTESFNIAIAGSLVMHQILTRLRSTDVNYLLNPQQKTELTLDWYKKAIRGGHEIASRFIEKF